MDSNTLPKIIVGLVVLYILYNVFREPINNFFKEPEKPIINDTPLVGPPLVEPPVLVSPLMEVEAVPLRPTTMSDCGYPDQPRGWYDVRNRGYRNDFCRHVGEHPGYWSCAVQGNVDANNTPVFYTEINRYTYDPNTPHDEYKQNLTGWHCP